MGTLVFVCPTTGFEVFTGLEMDQSTFADFTECFAGHSLSPLSQTASTVRCDRLAGRRRASNRRDCLRRNCHSLELRRSLYPGYAAEQHKRTYAHPNVIDALGERLCGLNSDRRGHGARDYNDRRRPQ